jgi:hypothetical protein
MMILLELGLSWSSTLLAPHKSKGELAIRLTNWEFGGIVALNSGGEFGIRPLLNEGGMLARSGYEELYAARTRWEIWASHSATEARKSSTGPLNSRLYF